MKKTLQTLPLVALMALAAPLAAQETDAAPEAAPTEEATPDEGLSMGEEVPAEEGPQPGQTYVVGTSGDWQVQCTKMPEGEGTDPCQLYQLLMDQDGNPVSEFVVFKMPEGGRAAAGATVITPLETLLTGQLTIKVDDGAAKRYPFSFCTPIGCYARLGMTNEDVAAFKRGNMATVTLVPVTAPDTKVNLSLSLTGFTAGFDGLEADTGAVPQQ
ncbi:invasion associated locus B family protein [Mesobacterium pallidum]|uniref:invasion associated locus B family protein n=1 Tax=Mesobacterium pallidum TaxID=2872037 RepID=UPI001EE1E2FE|nr:invasion associated locus B family protein [Mesobacterium pallidum]